MNYPQRTSTTDPNAFSLWPDAPASGEETAVWAGAVGYAQLGFIGDSFAFGDLDSTTAWGQSATLPTAVYGLLNVSTRALRICVKLTFVIVYRLDFGWHGPSREYARAWSLAHGCHLDRYHVARANPRLALPHRRHGVHARLFLQSIRERAMASCIMI